MRRSIDHAFRGLAVLWILVVLVNLPGSTRSWNLAAGWARTTGIPVLLALAWHIGAWSLGTTILRLAPPAWRRRGAAGGLVAIGVGWAVLQAAATLLGAAGLFVPALPGVILAALCLTLPVARGPAPWNRQDLGPLALATPFFIAALILVGGPPIGPDEMQYQVRLPEILLRTHALPGDVDEPVTAYAGGAHVLYALAMGLGGREAARPLALGFTLLGVLAALQVARRLAGSAGAWVLVPVVCGASSFLRFGTMVGADVPQGFLVALIVLLMLDIGPGRESQLPAEGPPPVALLGLLSGVAFAMKFAAPVFLAPLWLGWLVRGGRRSLPGLVAVAVVPLLMVSPWLVRNTICCGHPLFPLLGLPTAAGIEVPFDYTHQYGPGPGWRAGFRVPWDLFLLGREYDGRHFLGRLNPWAVLAAPGVFFAAASRRLPLSVLGACTVGFWIWASTLQRVVYLMPLWPLMAAIASVALVELRQRLIPGKGVGAGAVGVVLLTVAQGVELSPVAADAIELADVATGRVAPEDHILRTVLGARATLWVRDHVPPDERVAWFGAWPLWGLPQPFLWSGSEHLVPLRIAMLSAGSVGQVRAELDRRGVRFIVHQRFVFAREHYPELSEVEIQRTFHVPLALAEELLVQEALLRFGDGPVEIWELKSRSTR